MPMAATAQAVAARLDTVISRLYPFVCTNCASPPVCICQSFPIRSLACQTRIHPAGGLRLKLNDLDMPRSEAGRWPTC